MKRRIRSRPGEGPPQRVTAREALRLARTESFVRDFRALPKEIQAQTERAILRLAQNLSYPSLRVKKMQGVKDIWEASITMSYRLTFHRAGDTIILRRVGTHDILQTEIG